METYNFKELKDLKNGKFSEIPENRYDLEVVEATAGKSKAGNDMVNIQFKITTPGEFVGRRIWDTLVFADNSRWKIRDFLISANSPLMDNDKVTTEMVAKEIIGYQVSAYLEPGTDNNGNPRSNPTKYKPASAMLADGAEVPKKKASSLIS